MNDEIISMARRLLRGIEVSDETLMLDLIDQVGPAGEFMSQKITARRCRAEIWNPRLMDRQPWVNWELGCSQTMHDRVRTRLREILATHTPPSLPDRAQEEIESILGAAEARLAQGTAPASTG
jgi:trimethylamine--corrinoid protein Co-methyltransferase